MSIAQIDAWRQAAGLTVDALCTAGGVAPRHYYRMVALRTLTMRSSFVDIAPALAWVRANTDFAIPADGMAPRRPARRWE